MKITKWIAGLIGLAGLFLAGVTLYVCLYGLKADTRILEVPQGAVEQAQKLMDAIGRGDLAAAGQQMLGTPVLSGGETLDDPLGEQLRNVCYDNIRWEYLSECYITETGIARDVAIEIPDMADLTTRLKYRARDLITERMEAAEVEDMTVIYDENGEYREEFISGCIQDAAKEILAEELKTVRREVTLNLSYSGGQWWILPEKPLITALSGI